MTTRSLALTPDGTLANRVFLDDPHTIALLRVLNADGETARVVGGAVRNALIGLAPGDIDVTTTALPDTVVARARAARFRAIPTGIAHGTVTVLVSGSPFEVTTLREDVETDGRHAVVRFGRDFTRDALRRDFTINALSVDHAGRVHDETGGIADLAAGRVRFIGDPASRIREDYLRVLRFFRFSASYALGPFDAAGLAAAAAAIDGLSRLSRERIRAEVLKLLRAPRAAAAVAAMAATGVLPAILGPRVWPDRHARFAAIATPGDRADPLLALAALSLEGAMDVPRLRERLRLSNEERDRLERLASILPFRKDNPAPPSAQDLAALLFTVGRQSTCDAVMLWHVDSPAPAGDPAWAAAAATAADGAIPNFPLSGADIMARGIRSGPLVGRTLKILQASWIRSGFPDQPAALHDLIDRAIAEVRQQSS